MQVFSTSQAAYIGRGLRNIRQHLTDFVNPHRVTAEQAGAYTTEEVDALLSGGLGFPFEIVSSEVTIAYGRQMPVFAGVWVEADFLIDGTLVVEP